MMLSPPSSPSIANTLSQRHVTPSVNRRRPLLAAVPSPRLLPPDLFSLIFFAQREEELRFTKRSYNNSSPAKLKDDGDGIAQWQWNARKNGSGGQVVEHILNIDLVEIQLFQTTSAIKMITVKKLNIVNVQSVATTAQHQVLPVTAYVPSHSRDIITSQVTRDIFYTDDVETEHRTLLLTSFSVQRNIELTSSGFSWLQQARLLAGVATCFSCMLSFSRRLGECPRVAAMSTYNTLHVFINIFNF
jgi:hypothetical protein